MYQSLYSRPLLTQTPVLAVSAGAAGIQILGEDTRFSRFQRYEHSYQARLDAQKEPRRQEREQVEGLRFNPLQRSMYRRLLYGLAEYSAAELSGLSDYARQKVVREHKLATEALHRLKVDTYYAGETRLINAMFPHVTLGEKPADYQLKLPAKVTLRKLGISTQAVVDCLIGRRLLPADFATLSPDTLALR